MEAGETGAAGRQDAGGDRTAMRRGIACMLGTALSFSLMAALMKVSAQSVTVFQVVFFRGFLAWIFVMLFERATRGRLARSENLGLLFLRSLAGFAALALFVWGVTHVDLGLANALNQSSPLFVALLSWPLLHERLNPWLLPLMLAGFAGVWLIVAPDLSSVNIHALIGLGSGAFSGLAYILVRQLRRTDRPEVIVRWFSFWTAVLAVPLIAFTGWEWPGLTGWLALLGMGVLAMTGQVCLTHAYRLAPAAAVSPFLNLQVVVSLILGFAFFDELPSLPALGGVLLLLASSVLIGRLNDRQSQT